MTTQANKEELDILLKHINKLQLEQHEALEKVAALRKTLNPTEETMFTIREGAKKRKVGIKEEATGLAVKEEEEDRTSSDEANNQDDDPVIKEEARSKKLGKYFDGTDALDDNSLDIVIGFLDLYPRACLRRTCKRLKARVDFHQEDGIMIVEEDEKERKKKEWCENTLGDADNPYCFANNSGSSGFDNAVAMFRAKLLEAPKRFEESQEPHTEEYLRLVDYSARFLVERKQRYFIKNGIAYPLEHRYWSDVAARVEER